jgi:hypothetical protein
MSIRPGQISATTCYAILLHAVEQVGSTAIEQGWPLRFMPLIFLSAGCLVVAIYLSMFKRTDHDPAPEETP